MRLKNRLVRARGNAAASVPVSRPTVVETPTPSTDLVDAVDDLAATNRAVADPEAQIRLQDLRHRAAVSFPPGSGRADWPPSYADPFPDLAGYPPEIDVQDLSTEMLGGAVAHHGALLVRNAFDRDQVARTVDAIDRARAGFDEASSSSDAEVSAEVGDEWYRPFHVGPKMKNQILRNMVVTHGGLWLADSPAATEQVLADLADAGITSAIAEHFGERPFFSLQKSTLRCSAPEYRLAAWHQDGSFLDTGVRTMNTWIALTPCGGNRPTPGLEILPRRMDRILPVDGVMSPHSISYDLIAELATETPTVLPEFEPGDALLFDERLAHRTHLTGSMTEPRYALECWFFAPSHRSTNYAPMLV